MKILFTGLSSFTGAWFARELADAGHAVVAPLRSSVDRYDAGRARRIGFAGSAVRLIENAPFGSDAFRKIIRDDGPFDLLCHHAADVTNYRSADFDVQAALANNTHGLAAVLKELQIKNSRVGMIATGSVFEQNEGAGDFPLRAFSPYGLSKGLSWQITDFYCSSLHIPLSKFVIPNPFGPYEELRFTAYLLRTWKEGKVAAVKTPDYVRDNIHVDLLAKTYVRLVEKTITPENSGGRLAPSGYIESQGSFALRVAQMMQTRLGLECRVDLQIQQEFAEPMIRVNTDSAKMLVKNWSEAGAWDAMAEFYR